MIPGEGMNAGQYKAELEGWTYNSLVEDLPENNAHVIHAVLTSIRNKVVP